MRVSIIYDRQGDIVFAGTVIGEGHDRVDIRPQQDEQTMTVEGTELEGNLLRQYLRLVVDHFRVDTTAGEQVLRLKPEDGEEITPEREASARRALKQYGPKPVRMGPAPTKDTEA